MSENYLDLTELDNAIDNLEMAAYFLEHVSSEIKWKWEIISIHQALYGFLICALQGTAPSLRVYDKKKDSVKAICLHVQRVPVDTIAVSFGVSGEKIKEWLAEPYLISIHEALARVKNPTTLPWAGSKPLVTSLEENTAIETLIRELRNEFEHFTPKHWSINILEMPTIIGHVLRVIRFLALESNCVTYPEENQQKRVQAALNKIQETLAQIPTT